MTYKELVTLLASKEGKKKSVSVGNLREVLKCLKLMCKDDEVYAALVKYLGK